MKKSGAPNPGDSRGGTISKKRRGRQPRASLLSSKLQQEIAKFTGIVGPPVYHSGGFRDINGWLESIAHEKYGDAWASLSRCFLQESGHFDAQQVLQLKRDVVFEIMNHVVIRLPHECNKLVSTNARRQCKIASSGPTVMSLLESHLHNSGRSSGGPSSTDTTQRTSSGMDISSLLVGNSRNTFRNVEGASSSSMLPSIAHLDEGMRMYRERTEKNRGRSK